MTGKLDGIYNRIAKGGPKVDEGSINKFLKTDCDLDGLSNAIARKMVVGRLMDSFDTGPKDGTVDRQEFRKNFMSVLPNADDPSMTIDKWFLGADADHNKRIDKTELVNSLGGSNYENDVKVKIVFGVLDEKKVGAIEYQVMKEIADELLPPTAIASRK